MNLINEIIIYYNEEHQYTEFRWTRFFVENVFAITVNLLENAI